MKWVWWVVVQLGIMYIGSEVVWVGQFMILMLSMVVRLFRFWVLMFSWLIFLNSFRCSFSMWFCGLWVFSLWMLIGFMRIFFVIIVVFFVVLLMLMLSMFGGYQLVFMVGMVFSIQLMIELDGLSMVIFDLFFELLFLVVILILILLLGMMEQWIIVGVLFLVFFCVLVGLVRIEVCRMFFGRLQVWCMFLLIILLMFMVVLFQCMFMLIWMNMVMILVFWQIGWWLVVYMCELIRICVMELWVVGDFLCRQVLCMVWMKLIGWQQEMNCRVLVMFWIRLFCLIMVMEYGFFQVGNLDVGQGYGVGCS